jgi:hypothetical protein
MSWALASGFGRDCVVPGAGLEGCTAVMHASLGLLREYFANGRSGCICNADDVAVSFPVSKRIESVPFCGIYGNRNAYFRRVFATAPFLLINRLLVRFQQGALDLV